MSITITRDDFREWLSSQEGVVEDFSTKGHPLAQYINYKANPKPSRNLHPLAQLYMLKAKRTSQVNLISYRVDIKTDAWIPLPEWARRFIMKADDRRFPNSPTKSVDVTFADLVQVLDAIK